MIEAGGGRFRGIRFITASHPEQAAWGSAVIRPEGLLMNPKLREGFTRLAPLGLSFDAWMYHTQLGELVDLARAFPETQIVLDHVGGPIGLGPYAGKRDEVFAAWSSPDPRARDLPQCAHQARRPRHAHVRLYPSPGRIAAELGELAGSWRPYIETCIAAFGPERAMFESNFPVDKGSCSYQRTVERLQAHRRRLLRRREGRSFRRHRDQTLSARITM